MQTLSCGKVCENCAKYVCNAMECHSRCCLCAECDFVTEAVEIPDDASEVSVEVSDCCLYRHKT